MTSKIRDPYHFLGNQAPTTVKKKPKAKPKPTNPYGSLGPSPQTVKKVNAEATAAGIGKVVKGNAGLGGSNPSPPPGKVGGQVAAQGGSTADLISAYNIERAKILQGMAPQIAGFYTDASKNLQGIGNTNIAGVRDNLYEAGGGKAAEFDSHVDPRILASYNPDATAKASQYLGVSLPADTLEHQAANFGAAAALAPAAALQEGQYALVKAIQDEKVSNAEASKVSASTSKLLGYVADAYGNPIMGKNGKPIKLAQDPSKVVDPKTGLTAYQTASLGLRAGQIDTKKYNDDRNYALAVDREFAKNKRYDKGLIYKSEQAKKVAQANADTIDWTKTIALAKSQGGKGIIINKDGSIRRDKHNRPIDFTVANMPKAPKGATNEAKYKAVDMAKGFYEGIPPVKRADGSVAKAGVPPVKYQVALRRIRATGLSLTEAQQTLDSFYERGEGGRPVLSFQERRGLQKAGWTSREITHLMNNYINAHTPEGKAAAWDAIEAASKGKPKAGRYGSGRAG